MASLGFFGLLIAFVGIVISAASFLISHVLSSKYKSNKAQSTKTKAAKLEAAKTMDADESKGVELEGTESKVAETKTARLEGTEAKGVELEGTESKAAKSKSTESKADKPKSTKTKTLLSNKALSENIAWAGHIGVIVSVVALTLCCAILVFCFMTGDTSLEYVVKNQTRIVGPDAWLYQLSGLWGGREGSLLFWAWLIGIFNIIIAIRNLKELDKLNNMALLVSQLVLAAFVGVLLFSQSNFPFKGMDPSYFDAAGNLTGAAMFWGMSSLLEHWAMVIHPPTLFIGYAGLTIPFAYAISALIVNDPSRKWVERSTRYALFSWLFLGIGIGLGAVWAYVVLGWGGYWGWDPVENASLLSWLVGLALIHSFTMYRKRNAFRRWSVMCACLTLAFVIVGTFITRSGLVQSVHAFEGDPVSLTLFLVLILASVAAGIIGLLVRWRSFGPSAEEGEDVESLTSRDTAYYLNNVVMIVVAFLLFYLTISSALPVWLPFGARSLSAGTFNTIARPIGILYCLILAVCPLLSWRKTEGRQFLKKSLIPGICALVLFVILTVYHITVLQPSYQAMILGGGTIAESLREYGPAWYYNGLALVGFFVASLLFFNALFLIGRNVRKHMKGHSSFFSMVRSRSSLLGGFVAHLAMSLILVGLICSSMYVMEKIIYLAYDPRTETVSSDVTIQDYRLVYTGNDIQELPNGIDVLYELQFDVYKNEVFIGHVTPSIKVMMVTQQQKLNASIISLPTEDLFVVYRGVTQEGYFSLDIRINPMISLVWIGFALMMIGIVIAVIGKRRKPEKKSKSQKPLLEGAKGDKKAGKDKEGEAVKKGKGGKSAEKKKKARDVKEASLPSEPSLIEDSPPGAESSAKIS